MMAPTENEGRSSNGLIYRQAPNAYDPFSKSAPRSGDCPTGEPALEPDPRDGDGSRATMENDRKRSPSIMESRGFRMARTRQFRRHLESATIQFMEEVFREKSRLRNRRYDEKFGILQAPSLFIPDLRYCRKRCRLMPSPGSRVPGYR